MNKAQRTELAELAKKFGKTLPKRKDEYYYDTYRWDEFGDAFYDWLDTQKHSLDMAKLLDLMVEFREKLQKNEESEPWDYDDYICYAKDTWECMYKNFVKFCIHHK